MTIMTYAVLAPLMLTLGLANIKLAIAETQPDTASFVFNVSNAQMASTSTLKKDWAVRLICTNSGVDANRQAQTTRILITIPSQDSKTYAVAFMDRTNSILKSRGGENPFVWNYETTRTVVDKREIITGTASTVDGENFGQNLCSIYKKFVDFGISFAGMPRPSKDVYETVCLNPEQGFTLDVDYASPVGSSFMSKLSYLSGQQETLLCQQAISPQ